MKKWRAENSEYIKSYAKMRWAKYISSETQEQRKCRLEKTSKYNKSRRKEKNTGPGSRCPLSDETKAKISKKLKGKRHTEETKRKISEKKRGIRIKSEVQNIRWCAEYCEWRRLVFARDKYVCQECGAGHTTQNPIHAHHIIPFSESIEFAFDVDNGVTLCKQCHSRKHKGIKKTKGHREVVGRDK